jgi:cytochrome c oxidase cbb3-type subunit IV
MNPAWGQLAGGVTLVLLLLFIGIWVWAWRPRHRPEFDSMAQLPMSDADKDSTRIGGEPR